VIRIPTDYFKKRDEIARWKAALATLVPLITLGWWFGGGLLLGDRSALRTSHGPVWEGHALWEHDCEACHVPFKPIKAEAAPVVFGWERTAESNQQCESCHLGPRHFEQQNTATGESCGGCHRDHRGREVDLNRVPDQKCTVCHADLEGATGTDPTVGSIPFATVIQRFDRDHPDFAIRPLHAERRPPLGRLSDPTPPADPSAIHFNHALHLQPGLSVGLELTDLDPEDRPVYQRITSNGQLQLDCSSCHFLESSGAIRPVTATKEWGNHPPRSPGTYYLPISYQTHCQACHPIRVGVPQDDQQAIELPHGLQPDELGERLDQIFAARALANHPELLDRAAPEPPAQDEAAEAEAEAVQKLRRLLQAEDRPLPGRALEPERFGDRLARERLRVDRGLYLTRQSCAECHEFEREDPTDPETWQVRPTRIPEIWFPHARFSHVAHRTLDCVECHKGVDSSTSSKAIHLPSIESCRACHAPLQTGSTRRTLATGGARFDCVECHRYHNGGHPLQGRGAPARQVDRAARKTIEEFLSHRAAKDDPETLTSSATVNSSTPD